MKKILPLSLLIAAMAFIFSCKKKEYTCEYHIYYQPVSIIFKGFSKNDLKKVVVNTFNPDSQFSQIVSSDTFDYSDANLQSDTTFRSGTTTEGFYNIMEGNDYVITVLSTNTVYRIDHVKDGNLTYSWTQPDECSMGAGSARIAALLLNVNGVSTPAFYLSVNHFLICLKR